MGLGKCLVRFARVVEDVRGVIIFAKIISSNVCEMFVVVLLVSNECNKTYYGKTYLVVVACQGRKQRPADINTTCTTMHSCRYNTVPKNRYPTESACPIQNRYFPQIWTIRENNILARAIEIHKENWG